MYSKNTRSDLSTVLPLTETSGGKPPCLAHSAHVPLSRTEQLNAFFPPCPVLFQMRPYWSFLNLPNLDHTQDSAGRSSSRPSPLNLPLICSSYHKFMSVPTSVGVNKIILHIILLSISFGHYFCGDSSSDGDYTI